MTKMLIAQAVLYLFLLTKIARMKCSHQSVLIGGVLSFKNLKRTHFICFSSRY